MISPFKITSGLSFGDTGFNHATYGILVQGRNEAPSGAIQSQLTAALHLPEEREQHATNPGSEELPRHIAEARLCRNLCRTEAVERARREDIELEQHCVLVRGTKRTTHWRTVPLVSDEQCR